MNSLSELSFKMILQPAELHINIQNSLFQKIFSTYNNSIYQNCYIENIIDIKNYSRSSIINHNGSVTFNVLCMANIHNPIINETYHITITHINNMGIFHKHKLLTIFVPEHFLKCLSSCNIGDHIEICIVGKRTEQNLVCVAKQII